jgi:hypothetical protein
MGSGMAVTRAKRCKGRDDPIYRQTGPFSDPVEPTAAPAPYVSQPPPESETAPSRGALIQPSPRLRGIMTHSTPPRRTSEYQKLNQTVENYVFMEKKFTGICYARLVSRPHSAATLGLRTG